jgi:predicted nucleic acid-binding protein
VIVIDASALAEALTGDGPVGDDARATLGADSRWAAPALLLVETMSVIRGRLLGGKITREAAEVAVADLHEIVVDRVDETPPLSRIWELRDNLTLYDAAYVAAAEVLRCPLVTADGKLARATGPRCQIRLIGGA